MKDKRGSALILVIIVLAVLSILGLSLLTTSHTEHNFSLLNERKIQAQNIAMSGANIATKYYLLHPISTQVTISDTVLGNGYFNVTISKPDPSTMLVRSLGTVGTVTRTVTVLLKKVSYLSLFTGVHQTGNNSIDLSALNISTDGDSVLIQANVSDLDDIDLGGADPNLVKKVINNTQLLDAEMPTLGDYSDVAERALQADPNRLVGDYMLSTLSKENNENLVFETNGESQQIIVDNFNIDGSQGSVTLNGGGDVHLYIKQSGQINNPVVINGSNGRLFIYVMAGKTLELQANALLLNTYIYAPNATIEMQSDQTTISGAVIGNIINRGNSNGPQGNFHFEPLVDEPSDSSIPVFSKAFYTQ